MKIMHSFHFLNYRMNSSSGWWRRWRRKPASSECVSEALCCLWTYRLIGTAQTCDPDSKCTNAGRNTSFCWCDVLKRRLRRYHNNSMPSGCHYVHQISQYMSSFKSKHWPKQLMIPLIWNTPFLYWKKTQKRSNRYNTTERKKQSFVHHLLPKERNQETEFIHF